MLNAVPRWVLVVAGAGLFLLGPLVFVVLTASSGGSEAAHGADEHSADGHDVDEHATEHSADEHSADEHGGGGHGVGEHRATLVAEEKPLTPEEEARVHAIEALIAKGEIASAASEITNGLTGFFPAAAYTRFLDALLEYMKTSPTRSALDLYGVVLGRVVRTHEKSRDLEFHLRRLRRFALSFGGKDLFARVGEDTFGYDRLPRYYHEWGYGPDSLLDIVSFHVLYERWQAAFTVLSETMADPRFHSASAETEMRAAHVLARIAGASDLPEARAALEKYLGETARRLGQGTREARDVASWLTGVVRFYAPAKGGFDRGASAIERTVHGSTLELSQKRYRLDLVESLRAEANLREARLRDEYLPAERDRARQLFRIGWGAAQLGDPDELRRALARLAEDPGNDGGRGYLALLRGVHEIVANTDDTAARGAQRIRDVLERMPDLLSGEESHALAEVARTGHVPPAGNPARVLFTSGKAWADLEQDEALARVKGELRRQLGGTGDVAYLTFLECLSDLRGDRIDGTKERLGALLDGELPVDLSRGEVAGLLVLAEERSTELERVHARRARAFEVLATLKKSDALLEGARARILHYQLSVDEKGAAYVLGDEGKAELDEIAKLYATSWVEDPLEEKLMEIEEHLGRLQRDLREERRFPEAEAVLARCAALMRDPTRLKVEEGALHAAVAASFPPAEVEQARAKWLLAGEAYAAAASSSFGDAERWFEAAEAFMNAGDMKRASEASDKYAVTSLHSAEAERRYWRALLDRIRILREAGKLAEALQRIEENVDKVEARVHRWDLLEERALCHEAGNNFDAALADYDLLYAELAPTSQGWQRAIYRKARILHGRALTGDDAIAAAAARDALAAWEELAAWSPESAGDPALAEALYFAGEGRAETREPARARAYLERLLRAGAAVEKMSLAPAARAEWAAYVEKAHFSLADTYFMERNFAVASTLYRNAVERQRQSPLLPYGYYQLGECELKLGRPDEAVRWFQLGQRKVGELPQAALDQLPAGRGKSFWIDAFTEKIRANGR